MAREKSRVTDQAGVGPDPRLSRHLMPLREAKRFHLTKGEPDIRGWSVFTSSGQEVGRVGDLLVDQSIGEVVMFDVNRGDTGDQTIAPLRAAWIDRETKRVILDSAQLTPTADTSATARTPVPPPATPVPTVIATPDEELEREQREAQDLTRGERTVRSDEVVADRRLADDDAGIPLADRLRIERRRGDDYPDTPA